MKRSSGSDPSPSSAQSKGVDREKLLKSILPNMDFIGPHADRIALCTKMQDPNWDNVEGTEFPPFDDGYGDDYYRDDDDRQALKEESELVRLDELDRRQARRESLKPLYDIAKQRFERNQANQDKAMKFDKFAHKYANSSDSASHSEDEPSEHVNEEREPRYTESPPENKARQSNTSSVTTADVSAAQMLFTDVERINERSDFESRTEGLLAFDRSSKQPVIIVGAKDTAEYTARGGLSSSKFLIVRDFKHGEESDIKVDEISDDPFSQAAIKEIMNSDYAPSKKSLTKAGKQVQANRELQPNRDMQMENRYRLAMDAADIQFEPFVYEYKQYVAEYERSVEKMRNDGGANEEVEANLKVLKAKVGNLEKKVADIKKAMAAPVIPTKVDIREKIQQKLKNQKKEAIKGEQNGAVGKSFKEMVEAVDESDDSSSSLDF